MTLHLAASFSRDAPLLGAVLRLYGAAAGCGLRPESEKGALPARLTALLFCGVLLAPGKLVYLPLAALLLLVPAARGWGTTPGRRSAPIWPPVWRWRCC